MENSWSEVGVVPFTKKCLMNKKVCHDVTDKDYSNFDIFHDIQSQNNFSTTQFNIMLNIICYKGDALKAQFTENTIWERQATMTVMVPQTCKHQEAIADANTSMSSQTNMFKVAEINRRTPEAAEMENCKQSWVEYHLRCKDALLILERLVNELEKNVGQQTSKELETLLWWKGVSVSKMGNVANRCILHKKIAEGGAEEVSIFTHGQRTTRLSLMH